MVRYPFSCHAGWGLKNQGLTKCKERRRTMHLSEKALLATLSVGMWTGRKLRRDVSNYVTESRGAEKDSGRFWLRLIGRPALKEFYDLEREARQFHRMNTLAWGYDGTGVVPSEQYAKYAAAMRKFREKWETAKRKFTPEYPKRVEEDKKRRLGKFFKPEDYPEVNDVLRRFHFDIEVLPLPEVGDFRVSLSDEETKRARHEIEVTINTRLEEGLRGLWERIGEALGRLVRVLGAEKPRIYDTLLGNLQELVEAVGHLNITGNKGLTEMRNALQKQLCSSFKTGDLREDEATRKKALKTAKALMKKMAGYTG